MKRISFMLFVSVTMFSFFSTPLFAGEIDILMNKLVEKGILEKSEAVEILTEMQKEEVRQKSAIRKIATETAKETVKEEAGMSMPDIPKWVSKIKVKGDLRLRHDTQWRDERKVGGTAKDYHRNRERFRLRLGMKAKTGENTEVGVRLASGSGYQNTTNQSFDEHARGKDIFIDRAYGSWKPADFIKFVGGKHKNPIFTSSLVWDSDVNPEGLSEQFKFDINNKCSVFANLGQWFIEELNVKDTNTDPTLLVYQLGAEIRPMETLSISLALSYYDFMHLDDLEWSAGILSDKSEFLGYNNKHSQQMIFDGNGNLLNEFSCWEVGAKAKVKNVLPVPFSIFVSFITNSDADINDLVAGGVDPGDSDPAKLAAYGGDDRDTGWQIGLSLGNKKKKGDWYAKYFYQELEDYAFPAVFVDSDFHGGGTNNKGHCLQGRYFVTDNIQARATGFFTERDDERKDGIKDEDRIQLDLILAF